MDAYKGICLVLIGLVGAIIFVWQLLALTLA